MRHYGFAFFILILFPALIFAEPTKASASKKLEIPQPNLFAQHFFMGPDQRLQNKVSEVRGFVFLESSNRAKNSRYAIVTGFAPGIVKSQSVYGLSDIQGAKKWIEKDLEIGEFEGAEIKKLNVPLGPKQSKTLYWVGQRSFDTLEAAQAEIALSKAVVEAQGSDFKDQVKQAQTAFAGAEPQPVVEIKTPAQYQREEEIALKFFDQLDIGNEMFGPFQGETSGEKFIWQSFGETTWRLTNLESTDYRDQVGFWTNRFVFKGIRFPFNTLDPFLEGTAALDSSGVDFKDTLITLGGVEWRPLARSPWIQNYRPFSLPLLEWVRSFRFLFAYADRRNLKDEITGSRNHDLEAGLTIFYEFGVDKPSVSEGSPSTFPDYLRNYTWGEYFGSYLYRKTNFTGEDQFNAWILNSSVILGVKTPALPLPSNPLLEEVVLMPYLRFEHVNNTEFSFSYENRYFLAVGLRWMPFNSYRYKENEWLFKTKFFAEYVGIGKVHYLRQDDDPSDSIDYDLRFGVNMSSRRF